VADAQYRFPSASQSAGLQQLVQELSAQLWFSYRGRIPEHRLRHAQLAEAIEAWNASSQNAADRQVMTTWLLDAMRTSMPGSKKPMPATPKFTGSTEASTLPEPSESQPADPKVPVAEPTGSEPTTETPESAETEDPLFDMPAGEEPTELPADPATENPFGDDPLGI
jgi:hypothetical protein